ncbi:glial maturation factor [Dichotomocladium elegans]|nr:glial maturation factor [Dichotomocladium elegans]
MSTCDIAPELVEKIKQFRFAKYSSGNAAFVYEVYDNISIEDLVEELPENSPRFIILSYELVHSDGRKNFPLVFIFWCPSTAKTEIMMLYASAKAFLQDKIDVNRGIDIREADQFTDEFLVSELKSV